LVVMLWVELGAHGEQLAAVAPGGEDVLHHLGCGALFRSFVVLDYRGKNTSKNEMGLAKGRREIGLSVVM
jgi:hypothetical protein